MATNSTQCVTDDFTRRKKMGHLIEVFGNTFDAEIIHSVAVNHDYDVETTSNTLLEMLSNADAIRNLSTEERNKQDGNKDLVSYANTMLQNTPRRNDDDRDVIIESEQALVPQKRNVREVSSSPKRLPPPTSAPRKSKKELDFDRVILHVRQGTRVLIFMRGLPGSGKSYLAKQIVDKGIGLRNYHKFILSADDYFINRRTGLYEYDVTKLQTAHEWNQQRAYRNVSEGISPIIIDNTNTEMWEMRSYALMGTNYGYCIEIVEPFTYWAFNEKELARRNGHGVPRSKIKSMLERYQKNITTEKLFAMYNLSYNKNFKPPLNRSYPPIPHVEMYNVNSRNFHKESKYADNVIFENLKQNWTSTNLMDFENETTLNVSDDKETNVKESLPIDNLLMHRPATFSNCENDTSVLKPIAWNCSEKHVLAPNINTSEPELKKARTFSLNIEVPSTKESENCTPHKKFENAFNLSDDEVVLVDIAKTKKSINVYPTLDLSSWGLPDNAVSSWESWDVVSPLNGPREPHNVGNIERSSHVESFLESTESTTNTSASDFALLHLNVVHSDVKVLIAVSRNINAGTTVTPPSSPPKKTLLDKSSMTDDYILNSVVMLEYNESIGKGFDELISLFPNIPTVYLKDIYEKCKRNLNWAVDLLLDDSGEFLQSIQSSDTYINPSNTNGNIKASYNQSNHKNEMCLQMNMQELTITENKFRNVELNSKIKTPPKQVIDIKKHIENNVEINKNYYSEHVLKIKSQRHGTLYEPLDSYKENKPSTSTSISSVEEIISINSDPETEHEQDLDYTQIDDSDEEETVELNLGEAVVSKLENMFGFPEAFPRGLLPVVQVPMWLAKQLHALYIESLFQQMEAQNSVLETITKEDEEFAKKLQMQEQMQLQEKMEVPDLRVIMNEQAASNLCKKDSEEWKKLTPDTLAAKLTRQKLFTSFPSVDQTVLMEILHAHNNCYAQTVEVLLASTEEDKIYDPDGTVREPPITETIVNEMKTAEEEINDCVVGSDVPKPASEYREEASKHLKRHNDFIQKAQQAYQSKHYGVAQFYSKIAKTHTQLFDQANSLAASAFLEEHSKKLQNFHTLDLHYLYVKEAIPALDMFLDTNIQLLQGTSTQTENLFVITGRGKRSDKGKSRIKPAVIARLRKRNIWYCEINPGLLKIRVRQHSAITSNIP